MRALRFAFWMLPALLVLSGAGPSGVPYRVQPGSQFHIEGTSTLGSYRCEATQVAGQGHARPTEPVRVTATVTVPVLAFDCGRDAMNRDFYRALKAEAHATIRITITDAALLDHPDATDWVPVRAQGTLRLAGAERAVTIQAEGRRSSATEVHIRGSYALQMSDYGIDPPSGLLGLVRAHDRVVASFDLVAKAE